MIDSSKASPTIKVKSILEFLFLFIVIAVLFFSPLGLPSTVIRFTDISGILSLFIIFSLSMLGFRLKIRKLRLTAPLFFLLIFIFLEFFLPVIGGFVWSDTTVVSSSIRAFLYWFPCLLLLMLIFPRKRVEHITPYDKILYIALLTNLVVAAIELAVYYGKLPGSLNVRNYLEAFASINEADRYAYNRIWSAGFFSNSSGLGAFASIATSHFLAKIIISKKSLFKETFAILVSLVLIAMSTSRSALISSLIAIIIFLFLVGNEKIINNRIFFSKLFYSKVLTSSILFTGVMFILYSSNDLFYRYQRLSGGLNADYSASTRIDYLWPRALQFYNNLGHPTFGNPVQFAGIIDSGYLTYFLQGGLFFFLISLLLPISMFASGCYAYLFKGKKNYPTFFIMFFSIYILIGMININPLRDIVVITFVSISIIEFSAQENRVE